MAQEVTQRLNCPLRATSMVAAPAIMIIEPKIINRHHPNDLHSKTSFGSTVSAEIRAMNIAAAVNTPK